MTSYQSYVPSNNPCMPALQSMYQALAVYTLCSAARTRGNIAEQDQALQCRHRAMGQKLRCKQTIHADGQRQASQGPRTALPQPCKPNGWDSMQAPELGELTRSRSTTSCPGSPSMCSPCWSMLERLQSQYSWRQATGCDRIHSLNTTQTGAASSKVSGGPVMQGMATASSHTLDHAPCL